MNPINPHVILAKPEINHPSLFKEGQRVVNSSTTRNTTLLAKDGTVEVNYTTPQKPHPGEK